MQYTTTDFELKLDLRTAATIASLNQGIMNPSDLLVLADTMYNFYGGSVNYTVAFDPKFPKMSAVYYNNMVEVDSRKYVQRLGSTMWNVEFIGYYYEVNSYDGSATCPKACNVSVIASDDDIYDDDYSYDPSGSCSIPDYVFKYTKFDDEDKTIYLNLYSGEIYTVNENRMDPGFIGCATTSVGSNGKLGYLEPKSATEFRDNLYQNPFNQMLPSLILSVLHRATQLFFWRL